MGPAKSGAELSLHPRLSHGGQIKSMGEGRWRLEIPAGPGDQYRLAQVEDYTGLRRHEFPWKSPVVLSVRARASHREIPGTWGFGLWNDPFALSLGFGGASRALPALPNAAWFFFASPPNYLSLRDDIPALGALAATFRSLEVPALLLAPAGLALPLAFLPPGARLLRWAARRIIRQDAGSLHLDPTQWHDYQLDWRTEEVTFKVDGDVAFATFVVPSTPLGLVIWIDNQYAALPPDGRLAYGNLANENAAWIEIELPPGMMLALKSIRTPSS
jgi:hypothetical protein